MTGQFDDAGEFEWELLRLAGTELSATRTLWDRLRTEYDPDAWGYAQLCDLPERQRAVVSDQLLTNCWSIAANMIEANTHLDAVREVGIDIRRPGRSEGMSDRRRDYKANAHVAGYFRACGSALDCLAATATTVLRLPRSIQRGSLGDWRLNGNRGVRGLVERMEGRYPDPQRLAWREFAESLSEPGTDNFPDWLSWALEMRNALVHRGRHIVFHLPRSRGTSPISLVSADPRAVMREIARGHDVSGVPIPGVLAIVRDARDTLQSLQRFDLYLARAPWLPEMQRLADQAHGATLPWLPQPAVEVMHGVLGRLAEWIDSATSKLTDSWTGTGHPDHVFQAPLDDWAPVDPPAIDFGGLGTAVHPDTSRLTAIVVHPDTAKRIQLAEKLRQLGEGDAA